MKTWNGKVENSLYYCAKGICQSCHYRSERDCKGSLIKDAAKEEHNDQMTINSQLITIQEQKAEIDRLNENCNALISANTFLISRIDKAKAEAIKEFAERLKKEAVAYGGGEIVFDFVIDNLVKELTEVK